MINRGFGGSQIADSIFSADWIVIPYLGGMWTAEQDHHLYLDEIVISKQPMGPLGSEKYRRTRLGHSAVPLPETRS